jgi:D-alanyl-D-alanine carboxypeptidase
MSAPLPRYDQARARAWATQSTFANSNGLPDPGNAMTVRELAKLRATSSRPIPISTNYLASANYLEQDPQQNRNPLLTAPEGRTGSRPDIPRRAATAWSVRRAEWAG